MQPIALIHDCLKVLPNDMDKAKEKIRNGFVHACSGDPLLNLDHDLNGEAIRLIRASVQGMSLYQYVKYLKEIGLEY